MELATPLQLSYIDSPSENLKYLNTLDQDEIHLYTKGYIQCSFHIQEALTDQKSKFLNIALALDDPSDVMNYVKLLDALEISLQERVKILKEYWPRQNNPL